MFTQNVIYHILSTLRHSMNIFLEYLLNIIIQQNTVLSFEPRIIKLILASRVIQYLLNANLDVKLHETARPCSEIARFWLEPLLCFRFQ